MNVGALKRLLAILDDHLDIGFVGDYGVVIDQGDNTVVGRIDTKASIYEEGDFRYADHSMGRTRHYAGKEAMKEDG